MYEKLLQIVIFLSVLGCPQVVLGQANICGSAVYAHLNYVNKIDVKYPDGSAFLVGTYCKGFLDDGEIVRMYSDTKQNDGEKCDYNYAWHVTEFTCEDFLKFIKGTEAVRFIKEYEVDTGKIYSQN